MTCNALGPTDCQDCKAALFKNYNNPIGPRNALEIGSCVTTYNLCTSGHQFLYPIGLDISITTFPDSLVLDINQCVSVCPSGSYTIIAKKICDACNIEYLTCSGAAISNCLTCIATDHISLPSVAPNYCCDTA